jgi:hypothetical protein
MFIMKSLPAIRSGAGRNDLVGRHYFLGQQPPNHCLGHSTAADKGYFFVIKHMILL